MSDPISTFPEITEVQRLRVEPGDALVVSLAPRTSACAANGIAEVLRKHFGPLGVCVVLVSPSVENVGVISAAKGKAE